MNDQSITRFRNTLPTGPLDHRYNSNEMIVSYNEYNNISVQHHPPEDKLILSYISPGGANMETMLHIISVFNIMSEEIHVYCPSYLITQVQEYSNAHIVLHNIEMVPEIQTNIILTYGLDALYFLKQGIPLFIIGPYGLGGWVTPDNFPFLSREGFMGRPGGTRWEPIPAIMLKEELLVFKAAEDRAAIYEENSTLAAALPYLPASQAAALIDKIKARREDLDHHEKRWPLVPALASNISVVAENDLLYFRRLYINDTIATLPAEGADLLRLFDGMATFKEIYEQAAMEEADFWELIHALLDKKIIVLTHADL
ncbi:hypothetical protein F0L74_24730 [Chitinophaga agrisoli]|uniref:Uncharacterized protein n=1 Tax=Chitinophaga agrisoli TaxID=2607653 RepID=A0A5B2VK23_9BACT|nr:hypothetical protein [Chitinophaga agrisoli]KAA2239411.1 hypothetical protein F0L74_24730 [Chitinophaga agrisoli]